eukprot:COSAG02_NODE_246_length_27291_cov_105.654200_12_plen_58_part_00
MLFVYSEKKILVQRLGVTSRVAFFSICMELEFWHLDFFVRGAVFGGVFALVLRHIFG